VLQQEAANAQDGLAATMGAAHLLSEHLKVHGRFVAELREYADGPLIWREEFDNVVCTLGKNALFNAGFAGSSYSVTGPYLGLISSASFSAVAASDTMASHAGWLEAGSANAPTFSGNRGTAVFGAASAGAIAITPLVFTFTGSGTVQGAFLTFGTGAVNTVGSTAGTLFSAGAFGTAQPVISGNVLTVSYSCSM
jgi:hypothetical protein